MNTVPKGKTLIYGLIVFLFCSCYEPKEGCLDSRAVNYDVSADIDANCTYPRISVSFSHQWMDETFTYDSTYLDANGSPYRIAYMGFFLRDFEVKLKEENEFVPLSDKVNRLKLTSGISISYPEEIVLVESRNFQSGIDSVVLFDPWTVLRTRLGLDQLAMADSMSLNTGHPLNKRDVMSSGSSGVYYDYVLSILPDTSNADSQRWIYTSLTDSIQLNFMTERMFEPAQNDDLIFDLYYDRLFDGFEKGMTDEEIRIMWEDNVRKAIELRE